MGGRVRGIYKEVNLDPGKGRGVLQEIGCCGSGASHTGVAHEKLDHTSACSKRKASVGTYLHCQGTVDEASAFLATQCHTQPQANASSSPVG